MPPIVLAAMLALMQAAPATQPADVELTPEQALAEGRAEYRRMMAMEVASLPAVGPRSRAELVTVSMEDDFLKVAVEPPHAEGSAFVTVRVPVTDWDGLVTVRARKVGDDPWQVLSLQRQSADEPGLAASSIEVYLLGDDLQVAHTAEGPAGLTSVQFKQNTIAVGDPDRPVTLYVTDHRGGAADPERRYDASSFAALQAEHPEVVAEHLMPILRQLDPRLAADGGLGGLYDNAFDAELQAVLPEAEPDPAAVAEVRTLLARTSAPAFRDRRAAVKALRGLGGPGRVALFHMDDDAVAALDAEQRAARQAVLGDGSPLAAAELQRLRGDRAFLERLAAGGDPILAPAAARRLADLDAEGGR